MQFPLTFPLLGLEVHAHLVAEVLAYALGFQAWRRERRMAGGAIPAGWDAVPLLVGCIVGAALGARGLALLEHLPAEDPAAGGKTVIGGILGGWVGVEVAKSRMGLRSATGDAFVIPLALGIVLGRIGCFLEGLADGTQGLPTALPWGVDFGDGIPRHPAPLYEVAAVVPMAAFLRWGLRPRPAPGGLFRLFVAGYLLLRFALDFWKPVVPLAAGLGAIQWACLGGAAAALGTLRRGDGGGEAAHG